MADDNLTPLRLADDCFVVDHVFDHDDELCFDVVYREGTTIPAYLSRNEVKALRDHLSAVLSASGEIEPMWALGWYANRRHLASGDMERVGDSVRALCSSYTYVYPRGYVNRRHPVPAANSDETMSKPACKLCERRISK